MKYYSNKNIFLSPLRKLRVSLLLIFIAGTWVSCSDENEGARTPIASATISETNLEINQSMEIKFTGVADQVVVYTGDEGHNYDLKEEENNTGLAVSKGLFTYSYRVPGTFKVVVLASTYDTYMGNSLRTDTMTFTVKVKDDVTTIDKVYSKITPNVYYAENANNDNWVLRLPTKQVYKSREVKLNAKRQRLSFDIASDSSKIYIDDELWNSKYFYDLTQTHNIKVTSDFGSERNYKLYNLIYPEFDNIKLNNVSGKLLREPFDQDVQIYQFALPENTSPNSLIAEFAIDGEGTFFVNGKAVKSGDVIDISANNVYTIVRVHPEDSSIKATTIVKFEII